MDNTIDKFKLLETFVDSLGLSRQQIVEHWLDSGAFNPMAMAEGNAQSKKAKKRRVKVIHREVAEPLPDVDTSQSQADKPSTFVPPSAPYTPLGAEQIFAQLRDIIEQKTDNRAEDVALDSYFLEDLGCDSLDRVEIAMEIEREFGISIANDQIDRIHTVQDYVNFLQKLGI